MIFASKKNGICSYMFILSVTEISFVLSKQ